MLKMDVVVREAIMMIKVVILVNSVVSDVKNVKVLIHVTNVTNIEILITTVNALRDLNK